MKRFKSLSICMVFFLMFVLSSCERDEIGVGNDLIDTSISEEIDNNIEDFKNYYEVNEMGLFEYKLDTSIEDIYFMRDENSLMGYMTSKGKILAEPQYMWLSYGDGIMTIGNYIDEDEDYRIYFAELDGKPIITEVDGMEIISGDYFEDGYTIVMLDDKDRTGFRTHNVVINKQGEVVLKTDIESASIYRDKEGRFIVYSEFDEVLAMYNSDLTEMSANEIAELENYDNDSIYETDGLYRIKNSDNKYAIYDFVKKKATTEYIYEPWKPEKVGNNYLVACYTEENGSETLLIDSKGNILVNFYEEYGDLSAPLIMGDYIALNFVGDKGVIVLDDNGELYKKTEYSRVYSWTNSQTFVCTIRYKNEDGTDGYYEKFGYLDSDCNEILEPIYDYVGGIYNGRSLVQLDDMLYEFKAK